MYRGIAKFKTNTCVREFSWYILNHNFLTNYRNTYFIHANSNSIKLREYEAYQVFGSIVIIRKLEVKLEVVVTYIL